MSKPAHANAENAAAFQGQSVVDHYHLRLPYPAETFTFLLDLMSDEPRTLLDVGTGTGEIAREMVTKVERVDAVDLSPAMIARGKTLPNGDHPNLNWICGAIEAVELNPPYVLITAADSILWMDWNVSFHRFAASLTPGGKIALLSRWELPPPWQESLQGLIRQYSVMQNYQPFDLIELLAEQGLFHKRGEYEAAPQLHRQSIDDYVGSFHSRSSLSLERMSPENAAAFDNALRDLVTPWSHDGLLELQTSSHMDWGRP